MSLFDEIKNIKFRKRDVAISREDLSLASTIDLVEKIIDYNSKFVAKSTKANYLKLETAMLELGRRDINSISPMFGVYFSTYVSDHKTWLQTYRESFEIGGNPGKEAIQQFSRTISPSLYMYLNILRQES